MDSKKSASEKFVSKQNKNTPAILLEKIHTLLLFCGEEIDVVDECYCAVPEFEDKSSEKEPADFIKIIHVDDETGERGPSRKATLHKKRLDDPYFFKSQVTMVYNEILSLAEYDQKPVLEPQRSNESMIDFLERMRAWCLQVTQIEPQDTEDSEDIIHLEEDELDLLNWFNDQYPNICFVKKYPKFDDEKKYKYAKHLEEIGFLKRPKDKRRGNYITEQGRHYMKKNY